MGATTNVQFIEASWQNKPYIFVDYLSLFFVIATFPQGLLLSEGGRF